MVPRALHGAMIRLWPLLIGALLAGCATPALTPDAADPPSPTPAPAPSPFHAEGTYWVKPSQGSAPGKHEIPFAVNASGLRVVAKLTLGERYGPVEMPTSTMQLSAQLVDPAGAVLAKAERMAGGETRLALEGVATATGEGKLVLAHHGGSDEGQGGGFGDYVAFVLDVS